MTKLQEAARMALKVGSPEHVALWDAINDLVVASGGRNSVSTARMRAVAAVEAALRAALTEAQAEKQPPSRELSDEEILAQNTRTDGRREWSTVGAWLYPRDCIVVLRAGAATLAAEPPRSALSDEELLEAMPSGIIDSLRDPWDCNTGDADESLRRDILRIARAAIRAAGGER